MKQPRSLMRRTSPVLIVAVIWLVIVSCQVPTVMISNPLAQATPVPNTVSQATPVPEAQPPLPSPASPVTPFLTSLEQEIIGVYEAVSPGVVHITARSFAYNFFMEVVPQEGTGSGFVYDTTGHIVTNYHVIEGADELQVMLSDQTMVSARTVGVDPSNDLAVIKLDDIEGVDLQPLQLGASEGLRVGQFVVAIGNPFGLEQTLTVGVISALNRVIESPDERFIGQVIQTDAAINPGNSGGPLLDLQGRVIGVNSQIVSPSRASAGIGFAVPVDMVRRVVPELIANGRYPHPWLGATMLQLTPDRAELLRDAGVEVPSDRGLLVLEVMPGASADRAGIRGGDNVLRLGRGAVLPVGGDIIVGLDDREIRDEQALMVYLDTEKMVGDTVSVTVVRGEAQLKIPVLLTERPASP